MIHSRIPRMVAALSKRSQTFAEGADGYAPTYMSRITWVEDGADANNAPLSVAYSRVLRGDLLGANIGQVGVRVSWKFKSVSRKGNRRRGGTYSHMRAAEALHAPARILQALQPHSPSRRAPAYRPLRKDPRSRQSPSDHHACSQATSQARSR